MTGEPDGGILNTTAIAGPRVVDLLSNHAIDGRPTPEPIQSTLTKYYANQPNYWGVLGEQDLAFCLGEQGFDILVGPGGAAGKSTFAGGVDYLSLQVSPDQQVRLLIGDNKALGKPEVVNKCPAFTENVARKLTTLIGEVQAIPDFPARTQVLDKLTRTRDAVKAGGGAIPDGVRFVISNVGGYATGISTSLQNDFYQATKLTDASGAPLELEFLNFVPGSEITQRAELVDALGGRNPRSPTEVMLIKPVLEPPTGELLGAKVLGNNPEGAWLLGLQVVETLIIAGLTRFVDPVWKKELEALAPEVFRRLRDTAAAGVLLVYVYWLAEYSPRDLTDTAAAPHQVVPEFTRWETAYGDSADAAYAQWASPAKLDDDRSMLTPPQFRHYSFFWFDGRSMTPYQPVVTPKR